MHFGLQPLVGSYIATCNAVCPSAIRGRLNRLAGFTAARSVLHLSFAVLQEACIHVHSLKQDVPLEHSSGEALVEQAVNGNLEFVGVVAAPEIGKDLELGYLMDYETEEYQEYKEQSSIF